MDPRDPAEPAASPPGPARRFVPGAELGRGSFGRVIEAADIGIGRPVALKLLLPDSPPDLLERFRWEGRITGRLEHPSIVPVHEIGQFPDTGEMYIAMKRIAGRDMQHVIQEGKWKLRQLVESLRDASRAIAYAHSMGVVHRDLKPANIMLGDFGETLVVDWGLARVLGEPDADRPLGKVSVVSPDDSSNLTMEGDIMGTPAYMPPEQALGKLSEIDERSDVYSLGAILYEILAGRPPFPGGSVHDVLDRVSRGEMNPPSSVRPVPPDLESICARAMALKREDRFATAGELATELESWLEGTKERERRAALAAEEIARARKAMEERKRLSKDAASALVEIQVLVQQIPRWEGEVAKGPLWATRDRAVTSKRRGLEAYADALGALASAESHVPGHPEARKLRAQLAWQKFLEAEEQGDEAEMVVNRRIAEQVHDGRLASELSDEGLLSVRSRAWSCDCVVRGREVLPEELAVHGWHPWSGRLLSGGGPPFSPDPEPTSPLRLRVHARTCGLEAVPGAKVWAWRHEDLDRILIPVSRGSGGPPLPQRVSRAVFADASCPPRGPGQYLGVTPIERVRVPIGTWLLVLVAPDGRFARTLVRVGRTDEASVDATLLSEEETPAGFRTVLETASTLQGDRDLATSGNPIATQVPDFVLARDVVTCAEYAEFLNAISAEESRKRVPREDSGSGKPWWPLVEGKWIVPSSEWMAQATEADRSRVVFPDEKLRAWESGWPVFCVSWHDALAYARWRSEKDARLYTLPTGDQWEVAGRGPGARPFPWGHRFDHAWCNNNDSLRDGPRPARPDEFPRDESPWGIRGMAGNIMELCLNGIGEQFPNRREVRGGGWSRASGLCRLATRIAAFPAAVERYSGFRLSGVLRLGERTARDV